MYTDGYDRLMFSWVLAVSRQYIFVVNSLQVMIGPSDVKPVNKSIVSKQIIKFGAYVFFHNIC
jgi:hypothetical protein